MIQMTTPSGITHYNSAKNIHITTLCTTTTLSTFPPPCICNTTIHHSANQRPPTKLEPEQDSFSLCWLAVLCATTFHNHRADVKKISTTWLIWGRQWPKNGVLLRNLVWWFAFLIVRQPLFGRPLIFLEVKNQLFNVCLITLQNHTFGSLLIFLDRSQKSSCWVDDSSSTFIFGQPPIYWTSTDLPRL